MLQKLIWLAAFTVIMFILYTSPNVVWYWYIPPIVGIIFALRLVLLVHSVIFMLIPNPKDQFYKKYMDDIREHFINVAQGVDESPLTEIDGKWVLARPIPYYCFKHRLRQAWDVLNYRADAFYYHGQ